MRVCEVARELEGEARGEEGEGRMTCQILLTESEELFSNVEVYKNAF